MNTVILIGNLADEPKTTVTTGGATRCSFRLAVQRRFADPQTGKREADFISVVAWRQTGELCAKYLGKGSKCAVRDSLQTRSYLAQDGGKRYTTEVVAEEVKFLGSPANRQQMQPHLDGSDGFVPVDDELPF